MTQLAVTTLRHRWGILMLLGGVERSDPAKSICFDREANIAGREAGLIDPTWAVSLRQTDNRFVWREAEDYASELPPLKTDIGGFQEDFRRNLRECTELSESEAKAIAGVMSAEDVQKSNESELDVDALEALGYVEDFRESRLKDLYRRMTWGPTG